MRTYNKHKDSVNNWIGEIPYHWIAKRLKYFAKICNGRDYRDIQVEEGGFPVYGTGGIFNYASEYLYDKPSVLLGRKGTIDKPIFVNEPFWTSDTIYYTEIRTNVVPKFVYYLSRIIPFDFYTYGSAVPSMTKEHYDNMIFGYPPLKEQLAITNYLDTKTNEIDQTIADKEALINLYEEEKKALINEAVTKGLNPTVKLKPSGILWLGSIPEHWEVKKLKYIGLIKYGLGQPPKEKEDGLPLIRATNVERGIINENNLIFVDPDDVPYERDPVLKENDIIVVRSGAYTADSAIIPRKYEGAITGYDMVFRPQKVIPQFIAYCFLSNYVLNTQLIPLTIRAAQPHLNREELGDTMILFPPLKEQTAIVKYIETETAGINEKITLAKHEIELLKEFRQALIFEAVTGKICVL